LVKGWGGEEVGGGGVESAAIDAQRLMLPNTSSRKNPQLMFIFCLLHCMNV
jgi:hypothetical protein